ncbi:hypothetical protein GCM10009742_05080 [Kribbella karoonensis]|uniref:Secreted protein n=1 Tax=Kribbella karoonensis TaxID=324851 RepID=A0ABN2CY81_9ACTN
MRVLRASRALFLLWLTVLWLRLALWVYVLRLLRVGFFGWAELGEIDTVGAGEVEGAAADDCGDEKDRAHDPRRTLVVAWAGVR